MLDLKDITFDGEKVVFEVRLDNNMNASAPMGSASTYTIRTYEFDNFRAATNFARVLIGRANRGDALERDYGRLMENFNESDGPHKSGSVDLGAYGVSLLSKVVYSGFSYEEPTVRRVSV